MEEEVKVIEEKPKKKRNIKKLIIALVIVAIILGGGYYFLFTSTVVKVPFTNADYESFRTKSGVQKPELFVQALTNNLPVVKTVTVEQSITMAEVNAIISKGFVESGMLERIGIRFIDNKTVEISATVGDNVDDLMDMFKVPTEYRKYGDWAKGKSVYIKGSNIEYLGNNSFKGDIAAAQIGHLSLPIFKDYAYDAFDAVNKKLPDINGFDMDKISFGSNGVYFKGTIPDLGTN